KKLRRKDMGKNYSEVKTGKWMILSGLGWTLVLLLASFYGIKYHSVDILGNSLKKGEILSRMRINMLRSIELEKAAVMAITDKESEYFAEQSLKASDDTEHDLNELDLLPGSADEKKLRGEFHDCWKECRKIDKVLLDFAVQNTNLKAASLSYTKGADVVRRFEHSILNLTGIFNDARTITLVYQAITALLKIHNLQAPHINETDDKQMNAIEAVMKTEENQVKTSMIALSDIADERGRASIDEAETAFAEFMEVNAEVIRLSRLNTNIRSAELSMGRKRKAAAQCEEILTSMQEAVRNETGLLSKGMRGNFR
ncbi:MAG: hypothetical protein Q7U02_08255, partial [Desulfosalsimonadaceae bacterium]|nr:hypothetical protein [Desulfosalsimonadaceae bacterium]